MGDDQDAPRVDDDGPAAGESASDVYAQFRAGDEEAFRKLVSSCEPSLRSRMALRVPADLRRRISVADVLQETWVVAYRRRADYVHSGPDAFEPWVRGIAEKKLREAIRRHGRTDKRAAGREVTRGDRPDIALFSGRDPSPSSVAMSAEEVERVRRAMSQLSDAHREVLGLALERGLTLKEAALAMDRSHDAVKKLYGRAMVQLRQVLARDPEQEAP